MSKIINIFSMPSTHFPISFNWLLVNDSHDNYLVIQFTLKNVQKRLALVLTLDYVLLALADKGRMP
jgi:hypothetical protein